MNVFIIGTPYETAMALDKLRLNKQIIECQQILDALDGKKAWGKHPATLQYCGHEVWLQRYRDCLECYRDGLDRVAKGWSVLADIRKPPFHTDEFFAQMKRRLYTKNPEHYAQFAEYGPSDENWYWSSSEQKIIKYVNGKRV